MRPYPRVRVAHGCARPCVSCVACDPRLPPATLESVLAAPDRGDLVLGGGDASAWPHLRAFMADNAARELPRRIWVEAPALALDGERLAALASAGVHGVVVQIEAAGERAIAALGTGDGERAVAAAEALGLATQARLCLRPPTFPGLVALARRLAPRPLWIELVRKGARGEDVVLWPASIERALADVPSWGFSATRLADRGFLPPCAMPAAWRARPAAWRAALATTPGPENETFAACERCALSRRCGFRDAAALPAEAVLALEPVAGLPPWERRTPAAEPVPAAIVRRRREPPVICTTPWTTMEVVDPDGKVRQCCSTWTVGDRGNVAASSLAGVWNGPGYQAARRQMAASEHGGLCHPICSRLHDEAFAERELRIQQGSERFVANQLLLAEEIAERREVLLGKPLRLALCPSTYCNYDCIMCDHGRSPRRELPAGIWEELPELLPTLQSLTLLGGEPLASPHVMRFLREFDVARWPDAVVDVVTNGSLLTEGALKHMRRCSLGDVTVSLNAGTADVYARVQRGIAFEDVLANLDALVRFRDGHHRWFGITASFVLQPTAIDTLMAFGEIARARGLRVRLMALNPENFHDLDFYGDPDEVARVVRRVDEFIAYAARIAPEWEREARAGRAAVLGEAARKQAELAARPEARRLPLAP